jgi:transcription elongation factor Elf1
MNEKYEIIETIAYFFKCCSCGKNVNKDSIIPNNEKTFDCPHCNKTTISQIPQKPKEKKLCVIYCTIRGQELQNQMDCRSNPHARIKRYEMRSDFQNYELANI